MDEYVVTEMAGKEVAGLPSPGAGETIRLTDDQAAHPLRLGHIRRPSGALVPDGPEPLGEFLPKLRGRKKV